MKKKMMLLFLTAFFIFTIQSMPLKPELKEKLEKEGRVIPREKRLEKKAVLLDTVSGQLMRAPAAADNPERTPSGDVKVLVLLADFDDKAHTKAKADFDTLLFSDGVMAPGSFRDYYQDVSYGSLDLTGPVAADWVRVTANNYAYYTDGNYGTDGDYPHTAQRLVRDLLYAADSIVDYSDYDNDGDGFVDYLIVVHPGMGAEATGSVNDVWSHQWATYDWDDTNGNGEVDSGEDLLYITLDGVKIYEYCIQPELKNYSNDLIDIGVFCHEFGHMLGLPDLYDTDYSSSGIGRYGLMSGGSWGGNGYTPDRPVFMCAWSREQLGWVNTVNITESNQGSFDIYGNQTSGDNNVYRIWRDGVYSGSEYFLAENRVNTGWDLYLPGQGLMIYHIDNAKTGNTQENGTSALHFLVAVEQADGLLHLENDQNGGDAGDFYPGTYDNRSFKPDSTPSSNGYDGTSTGISILNISDAASMMTAGFFVSGVIDDFDILSPESGQSMSVNSNFTCSWGPAGAGDGITYKLFMSRTSDFLSAIEFGPYTSTSGQITPPDTGLWYVKVTAEKDGFDSVESNTVAYSFTALEMLDGFNDAAINEGASSRGLMLLDDFSSSAKTLYLSWDDDDNGEGTADYYYAICASATVPAAVDVDSSFTPAAGTSGKYLEIPADEAGITLSGAYRIWVKVVNTSDSGDLVLYDSEVFNVRDFDAVLLPNLLNDDYLKVGVVGSGVTDAEKADSAFVAAVYSTNNYYLSSNGNGVYSTASNFNNIVMPGSVTVTVGVYYDSAILDTGISLSRVAASPSSSPDALHRDIMLKGDDDFTYIYTGNPALAGIGESEGPVYYIGGIDEGIAYDSETHKLAVWHNGAWKDTDRISRSGYYTVLPGRIPVMNFRSGDLSNAPNPFNPSTTVNYSVGEAGIVKLSVYDSRGRLVKVLVERRVDQAGDYEQYWDGRDLRGHEVSSGVYYAVMELNGKRYARKMVMLK